MRPRPVPVLLAGLLVVLAAAAWLVLRPAGDGGPATPAPIVVPERTATPLPPADPTPSPPPRTGDVVPPPPVDDDDDDDDGEDDGPDDDDD